MNCKWISDPADIVIQGYKIKRPFFYLGEALLMYLSAEIAFGTPYFTNFFTIAQALWPPKPNVLDKAALIVRFCA